MGRKATYTVSDVVDAVKKSKSLAAALRVLGLRPVGGNYKTIHRIISENAIDTSHFTGQGWNVGLIFRPKQTEFTPETIFVRNSRYRCSWRLREWYKKITGVCKCESCGGETWLERPIPLEIHHVNGDNRDNRLVNLQLLCPNCHALTTTYRGRAKKHQ